ncbi:hypothetical protein ppKF707_1274 [Metapseudomonas furukawaii]|nr:hypothetical protein ppKF707_1274 [Pseudomonas furukawaii]
MSFWHVILPYSIAGGPGRPASGEMGAGWGANSGGRSCQGIARLRIRVVERSVRVLAQVIARLVPV